MSNTQGKLTKTYNPYLYLFEKGEWGITPFITTLLRIELRSPDRQSGIINLYTIEPYKSNSLLYEAVAAPCTSLVQSSAGTTVKVSLDIPAAPHTTSHLVRRLPLYSRNLASLGYCCITSQNGRPGTSGGCSLRHYAQSQFFLLI